MRTRRSPFILFLIASLFGALSQAAQAPLSQQSRHVQAPKAPQSLAPSVDLYVDELNGTIEKTQGDPVALEQSNYPHMTLNGTPSYFYSIFAMEKVVDPSTLNQLVIEAAQANPTISACLARTDIREGSSVAYRSELHELCHLPDLYYGGPINYDISKINGQIDNHCLFQLYGPAAKQNGKLPGRPSKSILCARFLSIPRSQLESAVH
jgi:hypothetical protein